MFIFLLSHFVNIKISLPPLEKHKPKKEIEPFLLSSYSSRSRLCAKPRLFACFFDLFLVLHRTSRQKDGRFCQEKLKRCSSRKRIPSRFQTALDSSHDSVVFCWAWLVHEGLQDLKVSEGIGQDSVRNQSESNGSRATGDMLKSLLRQTFSGLSGGRSQLPSQLSRVFGVYESG